MWDDEYWWIDGDDFDEEGNGDDFDEEGNDEEFDLDDDDDFEEG